MNWLILNLYNAEFTACELHDMKSKEKIDWHEGTCWFIKSNVSRAYWVIFNLLPLRKKPSDELVSWQSFKNSDESGVIVLNDCYFFTGQKEPSCGQTAVLRVTHILCNKYIWLLCFSQQINCHEKRLLQSIESEVLTHENPDPFLIIGPLRGY